jgi:hypothetical protein
VGAPADPSSTTLPDVDPGFVPRFREEVAFVPVGDEGLLYVEATGVLHQLDAIGVATCRVFDGATSIEAAATELARAFEAPREQVEADVLAFTRELGGYGLLEGVRSEPLGDALTAPSTKGPRDLDHRAQP